MFRTQKAQGLSVLHGYSRWQPLRHVVLQDPTDPIPLHAFQWALLGQLFVRPCPIVPAHGFVESRRLPACTTLEALRDALTLVWAEARAADPQAELLLTPFVEASANLIWRPGVVTIGPGHDGATSGRDSLRIPAPALAPLDDLPTSLRVVLRDGRITDTPYVEAVVGADTVPFKPGDSSVVVTQLRNGPGGDTRPDFIPASVQIEQVVEPAGEDLLAWAARVAAFTPGTVVYHPGGNCNDHYFVHCRVHQVPILTTRRPVVGERLVAQPPIPYDPQACAHGMVAGLRVPLDKSPATRKHAVAALTHVLHAAPQIEGTDAYWVGLAAMLMVRLGYAAALGEYRHSYRSMGLKSRNRDQVYIAVLRDFWGHRPLVEQAWASFHYGAWSNGYGGEAWAECTEATIALETTLLDCLRQPSPTGVAGILSALNRVVNLAHNNGWWLNKFTSRDTFDRGAQGLPDVILTSSVFLYHAYQHTVRHPRLRVTLQRKLAALSPITPFRATPVPPAPRPQVARPAIEALLSTLDTRWRVVTRTNDDGTTRTIGLHLQLMPDRAAWVQAGLPYSVWSSLISAGQYLRVNLYPARTSSHDYLAAAPFTLTGVMPSNVFDALLAHAQADATTEVTSLASTAPYWKGTPWLTLRADSFAAMTVSFPTTHPDGTTTPTVRSFYGGSVSLPLSTWVDVLLDAVMDPGPQPLHYTDTDRATITARYGIDLSAGPVAMQGTPGTPTPTF